MQQVYKSSGHKKSAHIAMRAFFVSVLLRLKRYGGDDQPYHVMSLLLFVCD